MQVYEDLSILEGMAMKAQKPTNALRHEDTHNLDFYFDKVSTAGIVLSPCDPASGPISRQDLDATKLCIVCPRPEVSCFASELSTFTTSFQQNVLRLGTPPILCNAWHLVQHYLQLLLPVAHSLYIQVKETMVKFEERLWSIIRNFLVLGSENPAMLVNAIRVVDLQEQVDAKLEESPNREPL